jgi:pilus assembly protein CpaF
METPRLKPVLIRIYRRDGQNQELLRSMALEPGEYLVGNDDCAIPLRYPTVSRAHGKIRVQAGGMVDYLDLRSRNGSAFVDQSEQAQFLFSDSFEPWPRQKNLRIGPFFLDWQELQPDYFDTQAQHFVRLANAYAGHLGKNATQAESVLATELSASGFEDATKKCLRERVREEFHGDGPIREYLSDPQCREILINGPDEIYVDLGKGPVRLQEHFLNTATFEAWALRTVHRAGRRLDLQHPICEATLPGGARLHAVIPPISARGISISIRRFGSAPVSEEQALASEWVDEIALSLLKDAVERKLNIIISGGTSTGKTSLLNFLCRYLAKQDRVITVEDTLELAPPIENLVQLQARTANADGVGEVPLRKLVQCALRMRPDRIIVGECRGAEVLEMLQALNTGHPGSLSTVHANSPSEALQRLELLSLLGSANLSVECIREWIRSSVDLVVQVERDASGHRHVSQIVGRNHEVQYRR